MDKNALRKRYRKIRESLGEDGRSGIDARIAANVTSLPALEQADTVFAYLSMGSEVDTRRIIEWAWSQGKRVAIPRCDEHANTMTWHWIASFDGLVRSNMGIDEPAADDENIAALPSADDGKRSVALVPGYSFDESGYRLGYGGGFYDVFLPQFHGVSVGLCRSCQMSDGPLPRDDHDIPVDFVVTEDDVLAITKPASLTTVGDRNVRGR